MGDKIAPKTSNTLPDPPPAPHRLLPPPSHRNKWGPVGTPTAGFFYVQNNYIFLNTIYTFYIILFMVSNVILLVLCLRRYFGRHLACH